MPGRSKYKRLHDLYIEGTEVELRGGLVIFLAVLNPFELQEARRDGQTARARMVLAMKQEGTDEMLQAEAAFLIEGKDEAIRKLVGMHESEIMVRVIDEIQRDPDWKERYEIMDRQDEILAREPTDPERRLLSRINQEYVFEVNRRLNEEREFLVQQFSAMSEEDLIASYRDRYVEELGVQRATDEYQLTELWLSARVCDGTRTEEGEWDHTGCGGHRTRAFEDKAEVRALPAALFTELQAGLGRLALSERQAKNSDRQRSSSESSPLPSAPAESTPSTPNETLDDAPGPLLSPSTTP